MKKILFAVLAIALLQSSWAFAQESGRKHGRNRDEGGPSFSSGDRAQDASSSEEKQTEKETRHQAKEKTQKVQTHNPQPGIQNGAAHGPLGGSSSSRVRRNNPVNSSNGTGFNQGSNRGMKANNRGNNNPNRLGTDSTGSANRPQNSALGKGSSQARTLSIPAKVRQMGITHLPTPIRDHSKILRTDRQHSVITPPKVGFQGRAISAKVVSPKAMSGALVKTQMASITGNATFAAQINVYNRTETMKSNYYWHSGGGFNYCHYYDPWGYHWYGWYAGPSFFWTRYWNNNWWWYDSSFDRWCYWHDGGWWWQDPFRMDVIYVYHNNNYTRVDTDQPAPNDGSQTVFQSNDGSRKVKVMSDSRDAFLYDTTDSPSFNPIYLASGIKDVKFSDTSNNRPLQIILTLSDGSFQMFDAYGNPYNQGGNDN